MKSTIFFVSAALLVFGCSQTPTPAGTTTSTPIPASPTASPVASATPQSTPPPALTSGAQVKQLIEMIDGQIRDKVLLDKELKEGEATYRFWSGAQGLRRIDWEETEGHHHFYITEGQLVAFNAEGKWPQPGQTEPVNVVKWAGFGPEGNFVDPPFQFIAGKIAPFPEDEVRKLESLGKELISKNP